MLMPSLASSVSPVGSIAQPHRLTPEIIALDSRDRKIVSTDTNSGKRAEEIKRAISGSIAEGEIMNHFYIEYIIKERIKDEIEECQRRSLLQWDEKLELRSRILESARSFFRLIGFEKTRVKDICRDLGISRRSFRKHFNSLDDILEVV